jgi:hypothetical protein
MFIKTAETGSNLERRGGFFLWTVAAVFPGKKLLPESFSFLETVDYPMFAFALRIHRWPPQLNLNFHGKL